MHGGGPGRGWGSPPRSLDSAAPGSYHRPRLEDGQSTHTQSKESLLRSIADRSSSRSTIIVVVDLLRVPVDVL